MHVSFALMLTDEIGYRVKLVVLSLKFCNYVMHYHEKIAILIYPSILSFKFSCFVINIGYYTYIWFLSFEVLKKLIVVLIFSI